MLDRRRGSLLSSALLHAGLLVLFATVFSSPVRRWASGTVQLLIPVQVRLLEAPRVGGGGGEGARNPLPVSRGRPPRYSPTPLLSPAAAPPVPVRLAVEPTLLGPAEAAPAMNLALFGDPLANVGAPSSGPGLRGGIGNGGPGGVGPGRGPGRGGPGCCGDGVYRIGDGVSAPRLLRRVEPEYSDEARKARWQGTVVLAVEVWPDGRAHNIRILQALGLGLDERAVEAVEQWRFEPGRKGGEPVKVRAQVEVNFRLL